MVNARTTDNRIAGLSYRDYSVTTPQGRRIKYKRAQRLNEQGGPMMDSNLRPIYHYLHTNAGIHYVTIKNKEPNEAKSTLIERTVKDAKLASRFPTILRVSPEELRSSNQEEILKVFGNAVSVCDLLGPTAYNLDMTIKRAISAVGNPHNEDCHSLTEFRDTCESIIEDAENQITELQGRELESFEVNHHHYPSDGCHNPDHITPGELNRRREDTRDSQIGSRERTINSRRELLEAIDEGLRAVELLTRRLQERGIIKHLGYEVDYNNVGGFLNDLNEAITPLAEDIFALGTKISRENTYQGEINHTSEAGS